MAECVNVQCCVNGGSQGGVVDSPSECRRGVVHELHYREAKASDHDVRLTRAAVKQLSDTFVVVE